MKTVEALGDKIMRRCLVLTAFLALLLGFAPVAASAAPPAPHMGQPSVSTPPATAQLDRKPAPTAAQYVIMNAEALIAAQEGLDTWDIVEASPDFSPNGVLLADSLLDVFATIDSYFVSPPVSSPLFTEYDQRLVDVLSMFKTTLVPGLRSAMDSKQLSKLEALTDSWVSFKASYAELLPALFQEKTYGPGDPKTHTISGTLALNETADGNFRDHDTCSGSGGYDDLKLGGNVVVHDGSGAIIATGAIVGGITVNSSECDFTFVAPGVPETAFYTLVIGHRTGPAYSASDMAAMNWVIALTIGS